MSVYSQLRVSQTHNYLSHFSRALTYNNYSTTISPRIPFRAFWKCLLYGKGSHQSHSLLSFRLALHYVLYDLSGTSHFFWVASWPLLPVFLLYLRRRVYCSCCDKTRERSTDLFTYCYRPGNFLRLCPSPCQSARMASCMVLVYMSRSKSLETNLFVLSASC